MKLARFKNILTIITLCFILLSCEKTDNSIPQDIEINDFVWKGMNLFYFWQGNVPDLQDTRFSSQAQLNSFLTNYDGPAELFESLRYQPGIEDRFSVIVDDYVALENSFQGIRVGNGMYFGLVRYANNPSKVFGYARYVVPASDADQKGITRGVLFNEIDGTQITDTNFENLLAPNSYTIGIADYNNGNPTSTGNTITLVKQQLQELPVHELKVITEGTNRIGYVMYNQFASNFDQVLNYGFSILKQEAVTDLVIDLRYNGGGSTTTATYLGAMITGQFNGQLFSRENWNEKINSSFDDSFFTNNFTNRIVKRDAENNVVLNEQINSLNLNRVYFLVSGSTASSSELLINSLSSFIDVYTIGTTTVGKVHGSITIYDSDNYAKNGGNLNPNHTWAMQPLVLEIVNKDGTNQPNGITPDIIMQEDYGNLGEIGERSDPLLERAIQFIATGARNPVKSSQTIPHKEIGGSNMFDLDYNRMYVSKKPLQ